MRDPLPKDRLIDAWNARQGWSFESNRTQAAYLPLAQANTTQTYSDATAEYVWFDTTKTAI